MGIATRILSILTPVWVIYRLYWLQGGYRQDAVDEFLHWDEPYRKGKRKARRWTAGPPHT